MLEALESRTLLSTVSWAVNSSGYWDVPTNWSTGSLPGPGDDVVIDKPGVTVTYRTGSSTIHSLDDQDAFVLSGGTLTASTTLQVKGSFSLAGGTLSSADVLASTTIQATTSGGTLDGVTLEGNLNLTALLSSSVTILNGLTLDGFVQVGSGSSRYGYLDFVGTQSLSGTGTIAFDNSNYNTVRVRDSGTTLTIGSGITIRGMNGSVGYNPILPGSHNDVAVIDHGTVSPDIAAGTIILRADNGFTAAGPLQASNGATLALQSTWTIDSAQAIGAGSTLELQDTGTTVGDTQITAAATSTVNIRGSLANTSHTLNLTGGGTFNLIGGTIKGGTVASGSTLYGSTSGGTLDGVTLEGNLNLTALVLLRDDPQRADPRRLCASGTGSSRYGYLDFVGTQSLSGTGTIVFDNSNYNTVRVQGLGHHADHRAGHHHPRHERLGRLQPHPARQPQRRRRHRPRHRQPRHRRRHHHPPRRQRVHRRRTATGQQRRHPRAPEHLDHRFRGSHRCGIDPRAAGHRHDRGRHSDHGGGNLHRQHSRLPH